MLLLFMETPGRDGGSDYRGARMPHATPGSVQRDAALQRLDELIAELGHSQENRDDLLIQHLQSARTSLLGAMPEEYELNLCSAKESAAGITDANLKSLVIQEVTALQEGNADLEPAAAQGWHRPQRVQNSALADADKGELYCFFHGYKTKFGVFYPTKYIFAAFPSFRIACDAAGKLEEAGFNKDEVMAVTDVETSRFFDEMRADAGLWGRAHGKFLALSRHRGRVRRYQPR